MGAEDIRRVIDFARRYDVRVVARNGGHSYGGYSSGDGVIVIDDFGNGGTVVTHAGGTPLEWRRRARG